MSRFVFQGVGCGPLLLPFFANWFSIQKITTKKIMGCYINRAKKKKKQKLDLGLLNSLPRFREQKCINLSRMMVTYAGAGGDS
jgi:hypothetical protein